MVQVVIASFPPDGLSQRPFSLLWSAAGEPEAVSGPRTEAPVAIVRLMVSRQQVVAEAVKEPLHLLLVSLAALVEAAVVTRQPLPAQPEQAGKEIQVQVD